MSPLGTSHCVDITITNDNITEPEETFSVTLIPVSDFVTFGIESASLDIHDDDGKSIYSHSIAGPIVSSIHVDTLTCPNVQGL